MAVADVESPASIERVGALKRELGANVGRVESGSVATGEVALESLDVFAGAGCLMMIGNDQRGWLQFVDQRVSLGEMPIGVGLVPHAVEPYASDRAVVGEKLAELAVHVGVEVGIPVAPLGASVGPVRGTARKVVRIVPVELRIIEEELDALMVAFVGEHFQRIFSIGRSGDDVPVGNFGVEHGKAVVMTRGDRDVLHPCGFGQRDPGLRVEFFWIEECGEAVVLIDGEMALVEDPFAVAKDAVDAPVNEHAEFHILKFAAGLEIFRGGLVVGLSEHDARDNCDENYCDCQSKGARHYFSPKGFYPRVRRMIGSPKIPLGKDPGKQMTLFRPGTP